ncbi:MAG: sulfurtransferase-like selenium metabolism protein YedF [Deltaproteobacteria bacterium HGW-Deltaproteobacteria-15]|jgi:selenium metabolism protein YedF|nr:MAG: sulfurtransferase-like selenium metabolism protein YedF [Deltaproteobacteria bacterium HGW-Deltaproteobacteria-15]
MESFLDCRGLACPAPVLQTKNVIDREHPDLVEVKVDNEAAGENVSRFLNSQGFHVTVAKQGSDIRITGRKEGNAASESVSAAPVQNLGHKKIMVMIAGDRLGRGDDELGLKLMASFLKTLKEMGPELWRLVLLNNGVKLAVEGSEFVASLLELKDQGVGVFVCGTCLNHFGLMDRKRVGETTNMLDIVTSMQVADQVINI